jgi:hypothetical protein
MASTGGSRAAEADVLAVRPKLADEHGEEGKACDGVAGDLVNVVAERAARRIPAMTPPGGAGPSRREVTASRARSAFRSEPPPCALVSRPLAVARLRSNEAPALSPMATCEQASLFADEFARVQESERRQEDEDAEAWLSTKKKSRTRARALRPLRTVSQSPSDDAPHPELWECTFDCPGARANLSRCTSQGSATATAVAHRCMRLEELTEVDGDMAFRRGSRATIHLRQPVLQGWHMAQTPFEFPTPPR